ncbi:hypothetical protein BT69DRAFT_1285770 [Atractiella rhizophila]|nr:hypothetical protein BT69DRAFT_1285770 [Atractiella rhizophila]
MSIAGSYEHARFCVSLSNMYSNLSKPILDLLIFNFQLFTNVGWRGSAGLAANYVVTAAILRAVTPSFGKLAAVEAGWRESIGGCKVG